MFPLIDLYRFYVLKHCLTMCISMFQVATMTRSEITLIDSWFIGPLMLFLNQYFNVLIPEYFLLSVVCVSTGLSFVFYLY